MANYNLTTQTISSSFQQLVQYDRDTGSFYDGTGSLITDIDITSSVAISASHAEVADLANLATLAIGATNTDVTVKNLEATEIAKGTPLYFTDSGTSGNIVGAYRADASNPSRMPAAGIAGETIAAGEEGQAFLDGYIGGVDTSLFGAGDSIYVASGGGYQNSRPTGSNILVQAIGYVAKSAINGSGVIQGSGRANDVPNIQEGYTWVGNSDGVATATSTASWDSHTDITSLNQFTASQETINSGYNSFTSSYYVDSASFDSRIDGIVASGSGADWLTNLTNIPAGLVSGSSQLTASFDTRYTLSGSEAVLPSGVVSGSSQINYPDISNIPSGIISGSTQLTGSFAVLNGGNTFTGDQILSTGNIELTGTGQNIVNPNGAIDALEVSAPTSFTDNIQPISSTNIRINADTEITASSAAASPFKVWDNSYTQGGQPAPLLIVNSANDRGASNESVVIQGGTLFGPGATFEPSDANTYPLQVTDAIQPRIIVYSQNDAAASGTNIELNGNVGATNLTLGPNSPSSQSLVADDGASLRLEVRSQTQASSDNVNVKVTGNLQGTGDLYLGGNIEMTNAGQNVIVSNGVVEALEVAGGTGLFDTLTANTTSQIQVSSNIKFNSGIISDVEDITITSNTASVDFSGPQLKIIELPSSGDTRIETTNVSNGQIVNILIKQTGTGTVTLGGGILQPSGNSYTATGGNGARDILTISTFDHSGTSEAYLVNVVNFV